jgi:hypothetical protein
MIEKKNWKKIYPSSFVVQLLIFKTWIMMDNVTIREIMMMGPNVFFKICFKIIFINNVKKIKQCCHGMSVKPSFPIVVNNIIYVFCEKLVCFEN